MIFKVLLAVDVTESCFANKTFPTKIEANVSIRFTLVLEGALVSKGGDLETMNYSN